MKSLSFFILFFLLINNCIGQTIISESTSPSGLSLLRPGPGNRYLVNEDDTPVYLIGGTAWTMPENCTREDVDHYLTDRKAKGFNYVQIVAVRDLGAQAIEEKTKSGTMNPLNKYGFRPFKWNENRKADVSKPIVETGGSPENPNDYWDHLDYIIKKTESMGMYAGLLPVWGKYYINNKIPEMRLFNTATAHGYGQFLGERYRGYRHIIWILGGDIPADAFLDGRPIYRSMAEGIVKGVTGDTPSWNEPHPAWEKVIITYHGRFAAAQYFNEDAWLRLNMVYHDDPKLYDNISLYYNNLPVRPMLEGESWYEGWVWNGEYKPAQVIRRQMYHTFFAGALGGYVYGVAKSGKEKEDQVLKFQPGWKDRLNEEGANEIRHMRSLLDQINWWELEPDQSIILKGMGSGESLKAACRTSKRDVVLVYFADSSSALIDLKKMNTRRRIKAEWYDPRNGNSLTIGKFKNDKEVDFIPPENWTDAVLKLSE